ncbi:SDR family oxidoreductase [Planosporangium mesophilum]|nr:SDR family oxidoreductase [Planosporangium mesophilum]
MDGPILVTGGTGTLGSVVVRRLRDAGRPVRVLSRRPRPADVAPDLDWATGDLTTGSGLDFALDGVAAVIHAASDPRTGGADVEAAERLLAAARAGRPHLVYVSIVGVDRVPLGYYRQKLAVERLVERSEAPWTIQRITQFHPLIRTSMRAAARLPVVPVPSGTSFQPIDVPEAAAHLIRIADGPALGRAPDLGGPQVRDTVDLARAYLRSRGMRRPVVPVRLPGAVWRGYREGGHLAPDHLGGGRTWEEFLTGEKP